MRLVAIGAAVFLLAACGVQSSNLDSNASVTISGKALGADGKPLVATRVVLVKELDLGEVVGGLFITAASLGLACLADHPPALCAKNAHLATTDSAGSYSFSIKGGDTQGSFGLASTMEVMVRATAGGVGFSSPSSLEEFQVQTTSLALPDLRIWQPDVSWASDHRPVWGSLPGAYGSSPAYSVEFYDLHGNQWWVTGAAHSGDRIDGRILEDLNGTFDVAARAHGTANGSTVDFTYVSGSVPVRGYMGPPPSRGALCAPATTSGVGSFGACPLTSGAAASKVNAPSGVVIDLAEPREISLVVVRGCTGQCKLEASTDLATWVDTGNVLVTYGAATVTPSQSARYVRVSTSDVSALRQISVW